MHDKTDDRVLSLKVMNTKVTRADVQCIVVRLLKRRIFNYRTICNLTRRVMMLNITRWQDMDAVHVSCRYIVDLFKGLLDILYLALFSLNTSAKSTAI